MENHFMTDKRTNNSRSYRKRRRASRRYLLTKLWPPFKPSWEDERLYKPSPYFGDQVLGRLFAEVGPEVPAQHQSPYLPMFHSGTEPWISKYWRDIIDGRKTPEQAAEEYGKIVREKM